MTTGKSVVRLTGLASILLAVLCALAPAAMADRDFSWDRDVSADRSFSPRFATNDTGDIVGIANTLMTCPASSSCTTAQTQGPTDAANFFYNNFYDMTYVDVDSDAATFDSSRATLALPAGAQVLFAGLYWGGDYSSGTAPAPSASDRNKAKFRAPGDSGYSTLTAATLDDSTLNVGRYQAFQDVTSRVAAAGNGAYTVADVQAGKGTDHYAGWTLIVAYRDTTAPARNLTVFDGLRTIRPNDGPTDIPVSGFLTPPAGAVKTEIGFVTYEGDAGLVGDSASLNGRVLSDAQHPATNFFDSRISRNGTLFSAKTPDHQNQLGFESTFTNADGYLANNATSATIRVTTSGDQYLPGVITFATDIYAPKIEQTKTVTDDNGGDVEQGDTLTYRIAGTNTGQDGTAGFTLRDPVPANTTYVPGSITLTDAVATTATAATDAAADDRAEFDASGGRVVARLGTGSSATTGGNVAATKSYAVTFKVKVNGPATNAIPQGTRIDNTATASFFSQVTNTPLTATASAGATVKAPDLRITKTRTGAAIVAGGSTHYTLDLDNVGNAKTQGLVTVKDTLPAGLTATSISAPGWTCSAVPTTNVTCTRSDALAAGASYPDIVLSADVDGGYTGTASNTATVLGGGDANLGNNASTDTSPSTQSADVALVKTASAPTATIGGDVTFTLTATNNGASTATSVAISDPLPGTFTYLSSTGGCTIDPPSGVVSCPVGTLKKGDSATVTITARAEADGAGTTVTNTATVTAQQTDPTPANNSSSATVAVAGTDLAVTKTLDGPAAPRTGDRVSYTVKVANQGPSAATGVVLMDALPAGLTAVTTDDAVTCGVTGAQVRCAVGTLASGASYTVHVSGTVASGQTVLLNRASAQGAEGDTDPTNNAAEVSTPVTAVADLSVVKSADPAQAVPGGTLVYRLRIHNDGPDQAHGVQVTDTLPAGVTYVSGASGCTVASRTVTCTVPDVAAGADAQTSITVRVAGDADGMIENTASVSSTTPDPDPSDNTSSIVTAVVDSADVSITKSVSSPAISDGDTVTYTLTAHNDGPAPANHVTVSDTLPAGVTFVSVDTADCAQSAGAVSCDLGTLTAGATRLVRITAKADPIGVPHPGATHQLTDSKIESQVDLEPGQTRTVAIDCGAGQILTDGSVRVDAVDQGTGDLASVHVLAAHGDGVAGYTATVRNMAAGRAQAKLFGNCLSARTSTDDGHAHDVLVSAPVTVSQSVLAGRGNATVQCGPGKIPVQPGFDFERGDAQIVTSEPTADGTGRHFAFEVLEGTAATFSVRCLDRYLAVRDGHTHLLGLERRTKQVTVPAGQTVEVQVICGDQSKGIVGDFAIEDGLVSLGHDPRPKTRAFRFYNPTGHDLQAAVGLLCLDERTGPEIGNRTVTNVATVSSATQDPDTTDNQGSATLTVSGGSVAQPVPPARASSDVTSAPADDGTAAPTLTTTAPKSGRARIATTGTQVKGATATFRVACAAGGPACVGTLAVKSATGRALAAVKYTVRAGRTATVRVSAKSLTTAKRAVVTVTGRDGRKAFKMLRLRQG
ncbi:MAG: conserved repeat domain protein [Solirubrobacterales bacterium]|nr:conserved repeat domain protein [Solirubrobacterales bacterium]